MRLLVSWIATKHDFLTSESGGRRVNPEGTHCDLYNNEAFYDKHILLSSLQEGTDTAGEVLADHLKEVYSSEVQLKSVVLEDVISVQEIVAKSRDLLAQYTKDELDIYISPGTPAMQMAWYILGTEFTNTRLFQVRPPSKRTRFQKIYVDPDLWTQAHGLAILENHVKEEEGTLFIPAELKELFLNVDRVAQSSNSTTVMLFGESGTGKEIIARRIHKNSFRRNKKFIALNCAAMGDDLLESRLFGHVKGAFTGAIDDQEGVFREADGGVLFLDEIGDISQRLQKTLLRVLQERTVMPIGTTKEYSIDVRVVCGSLKNLWQLVELGLFRADLFYRLSVVEIVTIPVREFTKAERLEMFEHISRQISISWNRSMMHLSDKVVDRLLEHPFPGNFREAENLFRRFYAMCESEVTLSDLPDRFKNVSRSSISMALEDVKFHHVVQVLEMCSGNKTKAASILGISPPTLRKIIDREI